MNRINMVKKSNFKIYIFLTILFSVFLTGFEYFPAIFQGIFISGDNRMNCFGFNRFYDKGLYPDWFICDAIIHYYLPVPFVLANFLFSKLFNLYQMTIIFPFVLSSIVGLLALNIGKFLLKDNKLSFLLSCLILLLYHDSDLGKGGTIRAWGVPIVLGFLLISFKKEKIKSYVYACVSWWFYPITLGMFFIYTFLDLISEFFKKQVPVKEKWKNSIIYLGFIIVLTLNVIPLILKNPQSPFCQDENTRKFSYSEVKALPEFGEQGTDEPINRLKKDKSYVYSWAFFYEQILNMTDYDKSRIHLWPINFFSLLLICLFIKNIKIRKFGSINKQKAALFLIFYIEILIGIVIIGKITSPYGSLLWGLLTMSCIFIALFGKKALNIHRTLSLGLFSSISMFILLYCLPYKISAGMHFPARQLGLYLPWFLVIFVIYSYAKLIDLNSRVLFQKLNKFVFVWLIIIYLFAFDHDLLQAKDQGLYRFTQTLPKSAIIAGHPLQMDFIPFFAKREVLACREIGPCYGKKIWLEQKQRTFDMFDALYSAKESDFIKFCDKYKQYDIYFVIDKAYFTQEYLKNNPYWQPFSLKLKEYSQRNNFFLLDMAKDKILFQNKGVLVVRCRDFLN